MTTMTYDKLTRIGKEARDGEVNVDAPTMEALVDFYEDCLGDRNGWKQSWARTQKHRIFAERKVKDAQTALAAYVEAHGADSELQNILDALNAESETGA